MERKNKCSWGTILYLWIPKTRSRRIWLKFWVRVWCEKKNKYKNHLSTIYDKTYQLLQVFSCWADIYSDLESFRVIWSLSMYKLTGMPLNVSLFRIGHVRTCMFSRVDTGCFQHRYTNFGHNNLGVPKFNLK